MAENDVFGPKNVKNTKKNGFYLKLNFLHYIVIFKQKNMAKNGVFGQFYLRYPLKIKIMTQKKLFAI